jgi:hypothetical protein
LLDNKGLRPSHLSDAMDELGLTGWAVGGFVYLGPAATTALGRAFTLRQALVESGLGQSKSATRHGEAARELASPGDILVIDVSGYTGCVFGGSPHFACHGAVPRRRADQRRHTRRLLYPKAPIPGGLPRILSCA